MCTTPELYTAVPKDIRNKETSFVSLISSAENFEALECKQKCTFLKLTFLRYPAYLDSNQRNYWIVTNCELGMHRSPRKNHMAFKPDALQLID